MQFHQAIIDLIESDIRSFQQTTSITQEIEEQCLQMATDCRHGHVEFEKLQQLYERVKYERGMVDIEAMLLASAPDSMFDSIPEYARPYRYGPLPYCDTETPYKLFQIDRGFINLEKLKLAYTDRAIYSTYARHKNVRGSLVVFCYVIPDGLGDLIAGIRVCRLLKEVFSSLEITLILVGYKEFLTDTNNYSYLSGSYSWTDLDVRILTATFDIAEKEVGKAELSDEVKSALSCAGYTLQIPTKIPQWDEEIAPLLNGRSKTVGEYGFMVSNWANPKSRAWSMGLHYLEKGILLPPLPKPVAIPKEEIYLYLPRTERIFTLFLTATLLRDRRDTIDMIVCGETHILETLKKFDYTKYGVGTLTMIIDGMGHSESIGEGARELKLHYRQMDHAVCVQTMRSCLEPFVVRGNQSFSEAILLGRLFFYDGERHNMPFIYEFHQMAQAIFPKECAICEYTAMMCDEESPAEKLGERMAYLLDDPQLKHEMHTLCKLIKERHDFGPNLLNLIQREFAPNEVREKEEQLTAGWIKGDVTLKSVIEKMRSIG